MIFYCPHCGKAVTLEMLEAEAKHEEVLAAVIRLGHLAVLGLKYAEKWRAPGKKVQPQKLARIL